MIDCEMSEKENSEESVDLFSEFIVSVNVSDQEMDEGEGLTGEDKKARAKLLAAREENAKLEKALMEMREQEELDMACEAEQLAEAEETEDDELEQILKQQREERADDLVTECIEHDNELINIILEGVTGEARQRKECALEQLLSNRRMIDDVRQGELKDKSEV